MVVSSSDLSISPMNIDEINEFFPRVPNSQRVAGGSDYAFYRVTNNNPTDTWPNVRLRISSQSASPDTRMEVWATRTPGTDATGSSYKGTDAPSGADFRDYGNILEGDPGLDRDRITGFTVGTPMTGRAIWNRSALAYIRGRYYVNGVGTGSPGGIIDLASGVQITGTVGHFTGMAWANDRLYLYNGDSGASPGRVYRYELDGTVATLEDTFDVGQENFGGSATKPITAIEDDVYTTSTSGNELNRFEGFAAPKTANIRIDAAALRGIGRSGVTSVNVVQGLAAGGRVYIAMGATENGAATTMLLSTARDLTDLQYHYTVPSPAGIQDLRAMTFRDDNTLAFLWRTGTSGSTLIEHTLAPTAFLEPGRPQFLGDIPAGESVYVWVRRIISPGATVFAGDTCLIALAGD